MACIFLAAKIEENCRRIRDVANVFHHLKQKRMGRCVDCFVLYACRNCVWGVFKEVMVIEQNNI